jgi:ATP-dependent helicase HrpB
LPADDTPEILEADLSGLALDLAAWGVTDPASLSFLDPPPRPAWEEAKELLKRLGALDGEGRITPAGKAMRELPLPPRFAHMVVEAGRHGQALDAAMLAVLASERGLGGNALDLSQRLDRLRSEKGERANAARDLARSMAKGLDHAPHGGLPAGALLSLAWPDRIAKWRGQGGGFQLANGRGAVMDEAEPLARSPFIVVADLQGAAASARILSAAPISLTDIETLHGDMIVASREAFLDAQSGRVRARQFRRLGALSLGEAPAELVDDDAAREIIFAHLCRNGLGMLEWGKAAGRLRDRLAFLHAHDPAWPDVTDEALVSSLPEWLAPFLSRPRALSDITPQALANGLEYLLTLCGKTLAEADRLAPEHFHTPAGSNVPIRYEGPAAFLAVRVQELFGLARHPSIMGGAFALTLELLSPAHRPIQVTRDLPGFWKGSWAAVRSEMRGRYPRHPWPEDPASAPPTARAKPRGT